MLNLKKLLTKILQTIRRKNATCTISSGWTGYSNTSSPIVIKQGNVVYFQWVCKPTRNTTLNASEVTVCTIPEGYRPVREITRLCQGTNTSIFLMRVRTDGVITVSRLRENTTSNSTYITATSVMWFPLCATWVI